MSSLLPIATRRSDDSDPVLTCLNRMMIKNGTCKKSKANSCNHGAMCFNIPTSVDQSARCRVSPSNGAVLSPCEFRCSHSEVRLVDVPRQDTIACTVYVPTRDTPIHQGT